VPFFLGTRKEGKAHQEEMILRRILFFSKVCNNLLEVVAMIVGD